MYRDEYLRQAPLFADLDDRSIQMLAEYCEEKHFQPGQLIVRQGVNETYELGLYVIAEGKVRIVRYDHSEERTLAELGPGECFGEMSVIDGQPRSASAVAIEPTTCLFLSALEFRDALQAEPKIAVNLLRVLSLRLRAADETPLD